MPPFPGTDSLCQHPWLSPSNLRRPRAANPHPLLSAHRSNSELFIISLERSSRDVSSRGADCHCVQAMALCFILRCAEDVLGTPSLSEDFENGGENDAVDAGPRLLRVHMVRLFAVQPNAVGNHLLPQLTGPFHISCPDDSHNQ